MMIVDEPFAAPELIEYLVRTQEPVLVNDMARKIAAHHNINVLESRQFAEQVNAGGRLICTSENTFSWIAENIEDEGIAKTVATFKDKALMRKRGGVLQRGRIRGTEPRPVGCGLGRHPAELGGVAFALYGKCVG